MWQKVAKFKGAEYFCKALYMYTGGCRYRVYLASTKCCTVFSPTSTALNLYIASTFTVIMFPSTLGTSFLYTEQLHVPFIGIYNTAVHMGQIL